MLSSTTPLNLHCLHIAGRPRPIGIHTLLLGTIFHCPRPTECPIDRITHTTHKTMGFLASPLSPSSGSIVVLITQICRRVLLIPISLADLMVASLLAIIPYQISPMVHLVLSLAVERHTRSYPAVPPCPSILGDLVGYLNPSPNPLTGLTLLLLALLRLLHPQVPRADLICTLSTTRFPRSSRTAAFTSMS